MAAPLFIPMGIILLYLLVVILPMLFVLDHRFVTSVAESTHPSQAVEPLYELQCMTGISASNVSGIHLSADRGVMIGDSFAHPDQYQRMFTPLTPNIEAESEASSVRHSDIFQSDNPAVRQDYHQRNSHFMGAQGKELARLHSH